MSETSIGELIRQAKGEDRSLRQYARDSGVDVAIVSKIINGTYIPKKQGIYEALTSPQAAPRGGVTCQQLIAAASTSGEYRSGVSAGMTVGALATLSDIPSSAMIKILQARGIAVDSSGLSEAARSTLKPEDARRIQRLQSDIQRFTATANGIILGSLGRKDSFPRKPAGRWPPVFCLQLRHKSKATNPVCGNPWYDPAETAARPK